MTVLLTQLLVGWELTTTLPDHEVTVHAWSRTSALHLDPDSDGVTVGVGGVDAYGEFVQRCGAAVRARAASGTVNWVPSIDP